MDNRINMAEQLAEQIWVSTSEGAAITGYNQVYLKILARKISHLPEDERLIQVRNRTGRYELWLPDLIKYIEEHGYGPHKPTESNNHE
jgi:hypothetical protein